MGSWKSGTTTAAGNCLILEFVKDDTGDKYFEGFVDGVPFEGGKGEQYPLLLGSGYFIPGFEEQVAGAAVGE